MSRQANAKAFHGWWKITKMEMWDSDYIDLVVPGFFAFMPDGLGRFEWGTVQGGMDCRYGERDGRPQRTDHVSAMKASMMALNAAARSK